MEDVYDENLKPSFQPPSILSTFPHCIAHVEDWLSPSPKAILVAPPAQSTSPSFSPSAPQVEPLEAEIEIPARDNVKRPLHFTETGVSDTQANKPSHTLGAPPGPRA